jgi:hypothetical protein
MADKPGDGGSRAVAMITALGAAFITRKVVTVAWTKIAGKEPPTNPEDPDVSWGEAVSWAVVMGVAVSIARLLATRETHRRMVTGRREPAPAENPD